MKIIFMTLFTLTTLLLTNCASKHPGRLGETVGKKALSIEVSGLSKEKDLESPFQMVELTVENTSSDWVRINRAEVLIGDPSTSKVSVVMGSDLISWVEANDYETSWKNQNDAVAVAGLAAAGAAVAVAGVHNNNKNMAIAGTATYGVAGGIATGKAINESKGKAERAVMVPSQHLYSPFSVPGKMFLRRWVLLNKPVGVMIDKLAIEFETVEGKKETYVIPM